MSKELFSTRLARLITSMGVTQDRFAELVGITPAALSQILSGKRLPAFSTLEAIQKNIGADVQYLMGYRIGVKNR